MICHRYIGRKRVWIVLKLGFLSSGCSHNAPTTGPEPSKAFPYAHRAVNDVPAGEVGAAA